MTGLGFRCDRAAALARIFESGSRCHIYIAAWTPAEKATIVGIDLTGSEARPSGWCVLGGRNAETFMICSDDEMFKRALASRPILVSIDSPLSIPFGRLRVEDDDPGRQQFGIMRQCERELKRCGCGMAPVCGGSPCGRTPSSLGWGGRVPEYPRLFCSRVRHLRVKARAA